MSSIFSFLKNFLKFSGFIFIIGFGCSSFSESLFQSSNEPDKCDNSYNQTLRYGQVYSFTQKIKTDRLFYTLKKFNFKYQEQYDYNLSESFPEFQWNPLIVSAGYMLSPGTDLDAVYTKPGQKYEIKGIPHIRSFDNFKIQYIFTYYIGNQGPFLRTDCVNYEISWCGDGVVDKEFGEPCDPLAEPWKSNSTCRVNKQDGSKCEIIK